MESKHDDINKFYKALNEFKKHKVTTDKTEKCKTRAANNAVTRYNNYFDSYGKTNHESALNEKEGSSPDQFKIVDNELPKWLKSKNDFNEAKRLIDDIRMT